MRRMTGALAAVCVGSAALAGNDGGPGHTETALSMWRLHESFREADLATSQREREGVVLDRALVALGVGNLEGTLATLDGELRDVLIARQARPEHLAMLSMRIAFDPPAHVLGSGETPRATVRMTYPFLVDGAPMGEAEFRVRVLERDEEGAERAVAERQFRMGGGTGPVEFPLWEGEAPEVAVGRHRVEISWPADKQRAYTMGWWTALEEPVDAVAARNRDALEAIEPREDLQVSLEAVRARNAMLMDSPGQSQQAPLAPDLSELARSVTGEVGALSRGEDPYGPASSPIDIRTALRLGGDQEIPLWVLRPRAATDSSPLVIVLTGGEPGEAAYMDSIGALALRRIAEERGVCIAVAPAASVGYASMLDRLASFARGKFVREGGVFLVGQGSGSAQAVALAARRPRLVGGVVCISGLIPPAPIEPPTLAVAGEYDDLVQPAAIERSVETARGMGASIEMRVERGAGHLSALHESLPEVFDWIERRSPR